MRWQQYDYDSLNRLQWVREELDGGSEQWKQQFTYDRWGNRTINTGVTYGTGINNKAFTVNTANNRLGVPGGQSGVMSYDAAGNLTNDTYTGAGNRTYDAENKITSAWGGNNQAQLYSYDANGQRIKRTVDGVETWQVYGFGGELVAEYAVNGAAASPQKEYGYRNGQLLVTATPGSSNSLSGNGTSAYMQAPSSSSLNVVGPITVEAWIKINALGAYRTIISREAFQQAGTGGGYRLSITDSGKVRLDLFQTHNTYVNLSGATTITTGVWHHVAGVFDGSQMRVYLNGVLDGSMSTSSGPTSGTGNLHIGRFSYSLNPYYFNGLIDEARVSNTALYTSNFTTSTNLTASSSTKGLWKFDGQVTADSSGNNNHGTLQGGAAFSADVPPPPSTSYYSGSFNGTSAYMQAPSSSSLNVVGPITVEAWIKINALGAYRTIISREAFQQAGTGGGYRLSITDSGKVRLDLFQTHNTYVNLSGATTITTGVWHHVAGVFDGSQMRVYLNGVLDGSMSTSSGPTSGTGNMHIGRFSYSLNPYYFNGLIDEARVSNTALYSSNFTAQEHLTASSSTKGLWKFDGQVTADSSGNNNHVTLQGGAAFSDDVPGGGGGGGTSGGSAPQIQWLVPDHLGTPRMVIDQTGSLANVKRHDYLPFGEELFAPTGGRSATQGYANSDGVRQQFTSKERDIETGLDYFGARYYASTQGRFTGVDPYDINLERQNTPDPKEANALFRKYISQPQHWNRYAYVLNNPLKYIDPDGLAEKLTVPLTIVYDGSQLTEEQAQRVSAKLIEDLKKTYGKLDIEFNVTFTAGSASNGEITAGASAEGINVFLSVNRSTFQNEGVTRGNGQIFITLGANQGLNPIGEGVLSHEVGHRFGMSWRTGISVFGVDLGNVYTDIHIDTSNAKLRRGGAKEGVNWVDDYRTASETRWEYSAAVQVVVPKTYPRRPTTFDIYRVGARRLAGGR